jgi:hypothetical protein
MTRISDRALLWFTFAAAAIFAVIAFDADAQPIPMTCQPFAALSKDLETKAKEIELSGGIVNDNEVLIIFGTPTGTSWTLVAVTMDTGIACIVGSGVDWFQIPLLSGRPV